MPKIRALHAAFWNDTTLAECSRDTRLFFMGLWTFADDAGVFEWHEKLLKSQIFPFDNDVKIENYLNDLTKQGRIMSILHNNKKYGVINNFTKYQKPDPRYLKFTIGDYNHVKNIYHMGDTMCTPREHYPEGVREGVREGEGGGVFSLTETTTPTDDNTTFIINLLKTANGSETLDGSADDNIYSARRLWDRAMRESDNDIDQARKCIQDAIAAGMADKFHRQHMTKLKYLETNYLKLFYLPTPKP